MRAPSPRVPRILLRSAIFLAAVFRVLSAPAERAFREIDGGNQYTRIQQAGLCTQRGTTGEKQVGFAVPYRGKLAGLSFRHVGSIARRGDWECLIPHSLTASEDERKQD
jgi:hypothetical protein